MLNFLDKSECYIQFFLLIFTVTKTYGYHKTKLPFFIWLFLAELPFAAFYALVSSLIDGIASYLIGNITIALLFSLLFQRQQGKLTGIITLIFTYVYTIICAKSAVLMLCGQTTFTGDGNLLHSVIRFAIYYSILILCSLFFIHHPLESQNRMPLHYWILMIISPSIASVSMLINTGMSINSGLQETGHKVISGITLITILLTYYLSYIILHTYQQLLLSTRINQQMTTEIAALRATSDMIENTRKERHELKNNYFYISSLVKEEKYKELEEFLDTELSYRIHNIEEFYTGHKMLDLILTQKMGEARKQGIHTMTNVLVPKDVNLEHNDLCSLLLNLLNNAIEGSAGVKDADIQLSMSIVKNYLKIQLRNRTSLKEIPHTGNIPTSKKDKSAHGIGLKIIKEVIRKYDGSINFAIVSGYFTVDCMLKLNS